MQSDLRERFNAASSASKILQERIEEMRTSNKEKDNTITRLKCRLQDLEEAFENAYKLSDDKEARLRQENKMFQDVSSQRRCSAPCCSLTSSDRSNLREKGLILAYSSGPITRHEGETRAAGRERVVAGAGGRVVT